MVTSAEVMQGASCNRFVAIKHPEATVRRWMLAGVVDTVLPIEAAST